MNNTRNEACIRAKRNYKDTLFRLIFKERKELLSLYNAINSTDYTDSSKLEIVTLDNAIYMSMKNDLAFLVDCKMNLYEHQASVNPNMPLRDLFYVAREYQNMVGGKSLYASTLVKIPTPNFVVFYNGTQKQPERLEMKLSDAYTVPMDNPALELRVIQLNISAGHNKMLMEKCPVLGEYSKYIERVRKYAQEKDLDEAVERAVQECIKEGILADFLSKNRAEAISVSIFEYDEEKELALFGQAEREQGRLTQLASLVQKKKAKGMSVKEIAEWLEEDEILIAEMWDASK